MSDSTTITGIDATYYLAKDLVRATAFYRDLLGLTPTMEVPDFVTEFTFPGGETRPAAASCLPSPTPRRRSRN